jgi:hypothetical protein
MQIFIYQYQRTSVLAPATLTGSQYISLPLPENLADLSAVEYSEKENSALAGAGFNELSAYINQHPGQAGPTYGDITGGLAQRAAVAGAAFLAGPSLTGVGQALLGVTGNPFLTVQFQSPKFKQHSFSWLFSPNNAGESASLKAIIDILRLNMLPPLLGGPGTWLGYPAVFLPVIQPNGVSQLYVFKHCVLTEMEVNYTPSKVAAFYTQTQAPASVFMRLQFLSIEVDLQNTYGSNF